MLFDIVQGRGQLAGSFLVEIPDAQISDGVVQVPGGDGADSQGFQGDSQIQGFDLAVTDHLQLKGGVGGALEAPGGLLGGEVAHHLAVNLDNVVAGLQTGPGGGAAIDDAGRGEQAVFDDQLHAGFGRGARSGPGDSSDIPWP